MEVNVTESWHYGSANKSIGCQTPTASVHIVMPDGTVKRCQINKNRQFPFFHYEWQWNQHQTKIIGVKSVSIKPELERAGFRYLKDYFEDEGKTEGYDRYLRWEATCDSIANRSAEFKKDAIPPVEGYLPREVLRLQSDNRRGLDFGRPVFDKSSEKKPARMSKDTKSVKDDPDAEA